MKNVHILQLFIILLSLNIYAQDEKSDIKEGYLFLNSFYTKTGVFTDHIDSITVNPHKINFVKEWFNYDSIVN
ncbi:MAG: hypothetical protein WCD31_03645, partial [Gillisia sp.]